VLVTERAQRLVGAAKKLPVPEGTYAIGVGLAILGITAYGFQILAAKKLSDADYSALNVLWAIVFVASPGLFQPLEQEVGRALSHRRARGEGGGPLVKRAATLGGILAAVVVVGCLIAYKPIVDELFNGLGGLMIGLVLSIVCYYIAYISRGTLSGNGRFGPYGVMLGTEGGTRIAFCIVLFAFSVTTAGWWGLALAIPPLLAVGAALYRQHGLITPGPDAPYSEISSALAYLLIGSVFAQLLSYISVLGVQLLATSAERQTITAGFITGVFIARIPLLLFQAIQAALLPRLARLASEGKHDDFRDGLKKLLMVIGTLCVVGTIAATLIGPKIGEKLFPTKWDLGNRDMFLLTLGSTLFILALTLAQGLIALKIYKRNAVVWVAGVVAFVITDALAGDDLFLRNEVAFVVGSVVAAVLAGFFLFTGMRRTTGHLEDLVEVVEHEPLEI
jgi:O-antigen/teichoic acid export membrane protein